MTNDKNIDKISSLIRSYLPDTRIILFGSRTKYEVKDRWSDYDLLIILENPLSRKERIYWTSLLNKELVKTLDAPVDILVNSAKEVDTVKEFPGHIIWHAMEEGVSI